MGANININMAKVGDGQEIKGVLEEIFEIMDKNKDGKIDNEEGVAVGIAMGEDAETAKKSWQGITNDMDADGNQAVEKSEWVGFYVKTLSDAPLDAVQKKLGAMKEKMAAGMPAADIPPEDTPAGDPAVAASVADKANEDKPAEADNAEADKADEGADAEAGAGDEPAKAAGDTHVTIVPYFTVPEGKMDEFKAGFPAFYEHTKAGTAASGKCLYYGFAIDGNKVFCREGYTNADGVLAHLGEVKEELDAAVALVGEGGLDLAVMGPAAELEKLKEALGPLGTKFYALDENAMCNLE